MIKGIGIDIVELPRIKKLIIKSDRFSRRILTEREFQLWKSLSAQRKIEWLAGRFAVKEAFSKAYGTGIGAISFQDIEVLPDSVGQPQLEYFGEVQDIYHVSISHSKNYAVAQVIIETN